MRATLLLIGVTLAFADTKLPPPANVKVDFEKDIQPILAQKCHACHGEEAQQSGLRLDKRQNANAHQVGRARRSGVPVEKSGAWHHS